MCLLTQTRALFNIILLDAMNVIKKPFYKIKEKHKIKQQKKLNTFLMLLSYGDKFYINECESHKETVSSDLSDDIPLKNGIWDNDKQIISISTKNGNFLFNKIDCLKTTINLNKLTVDFGNHWVLKVEMNHIKKKTLIHSLSVNNHFNSF